MTSSSIYFLDQFKIGVSLLFAGKLIKQLYFKDVDYRISGDLTNTDITMNNTLWLGIYSGIIKKQLDYIVVKIEEFFGVGF
jgi:CDP-4-dehydro-6-deoxyglucose reductase, E1